MDDTQKDPGDRVTGDEKMTEAQASDAGQGGGDQAQAQHATSAADAAKEAGGSADVADAGRS